MKIAKLFTVLAVLLITSNEPHASNESHADVCFAACLKEIAQTAYCRGVVATCASLRRKAKAVLVLMTAMATMGCDDAMTLAKTRTLGYPGAGTMIPRCQPQPAAWPLLLILAATWIAAVMA